MRFRKFVVAISTSLFLFNAGILAMGNSKDLRAQSTTIDMTDVRGTMSLAVVLNKNISRVKFVRCKSIVIHGGEIKPYKEENFDAGKEHLIA